MYICPDAATLLKTMANYDPQFFDELAETDCTPSQIFGGDMWTVWQHGRNNPTLRFLDGQWTCETNPGGWEPPPTTIGSTFTCANRTYTVIATWSPNTWLASTPGPFYCLISKNRRTHQWKDAKDLLDQPFAYDVHPKS